MVGGWGGGIKPPEPQRKNIYQKTKQKTTQKNKKICIRSEEVGGVSGPIVRLTIKIQCALFFKSSKRPSILDT